jgi:membrane-associated phospholipid phosphatase
MDLTVFRFDITRWFETYINKGLTEVLTLSYFSYYVLPTLSFILFFFSKNPDAFFKTRNYLLAIVIGWYSAFIFYLVLPAAGPDIAFPEHYSVPLTGLSPLTNTYLQNLSQYLKESFVRNTFPSMHFGIILITNYFAFRYKRKYFLLSTLPLGIMLGVATVYLRQHYLIDLAASFPIAIASVYVALKINKSFTSNRVA